MQSINFPRALILEIYRPNSLTYADVSRGGTVFNGVCLFPCLADCLSAQYKLQKDFYVFKNFTEKSSSATHTPFAKLLSRRSYFHFLQQMFAFYSFRPTKDPPKIG